MSVQLKVLAKPSNVEEEDLLVASLVVLSEMMSSTVGRLFEIVVHDVRRGDNSIVAMHGSLTGRHVGGSLSEIGLRIVRDLSYGDVLLNYTTSVPSGRVIRSSSVVFRNVDNAPVAVFCINCDVSEATRVVEILQELAGGSRDIEDNVVFSDDSSQIVDDILVKTLQKVGKGDIRDNIHARREVVSILERSGVFHYQKSVPLVAERLGVSRATIYSDLKAVRERDLVPKVGLGPVAG